MIADQVGQITIDIIKNLKTIFRNIQFLIRYLPIIVAGDLSVI